MLVVPERFNKNGPKVRALGPAAATGAWLLAYLAERLGVPDLADCSLLDVGCGSRFAEAIVNRAIPVGEYVGVDVDPELIAFLSANISDERLSFHHWDVENPNYNPRGAPLTEDLAFPIAPRTFDVVMMFSVITHQLPEHSAAIFRIAHRYVGEEGRLFFSANVQAIEEGYREVIAGAPAAHSAYALGLLTELLGKAGWRVLSSVPKQPNGLPIQDFFLCAPA